MSYIGSWKIDDLLTFVCNTQVFGTGVATDADGVPTYRVYEDETTSPILTGSMALLDSSNTAGFYSEQITLSAANGFEKGKSYSIYIAATVSSVAGTAWRSFQIQAEVAVASVNANAITAAAIADGAIDAATFASGALDAVWSTAARTLTAWSFQLPANGLANVTAWTVAITGNITGNLSGSVGSVTGAVGSVAGNVSGNVTGSVGSVVGLNPALLDVAVSTRLAAGSYTAPDNAGITAIQAQTDLLTFSGDGVDANIASVNEIEVIGNGAAPTWGPV